MFRKIQIFDQCFSSVLSCHLISKGQSLLLICIVYPTVNQSIYYCISLSFDLKSDTRELYVVICDKNANLTQINGKTISISALHLFVIIFTIF